VESISAPGYRGTSEGKSFVISPLVKETLSPFLSVIVIVPSQGLSAGFGERSEFF